MAKNCRIKFKVVNAFKASRAYKSVLSQIDINEEGIEASSYEELSSKIIRLFSKALSEQQAFFSVFGTDDFLSVTNKEFKGEFFDKAAMKERVAKAEMELTHKLEQLFKAAEESNSGIELVLSRFMTDEILSTIISKLDHYEKNKSKYRGAVANTVEGYLVKTLDWLSLIVNDEKKKGTKQRVDTINNINTAITKINQYLGNQIKFAFPQYVQIPFGFMNNAKYIDNFYIDSENEEEGSSLVSNPIDREITNNIIDLQKRQLKEGKIPDFGLARAFEVDGSIEYKLYRVTYDKDFIYTELPNKFTGENLYSEKKGELFRPNNRKISPFSVNGQSDFTNFISNFDNITPKRVGDRTIPEHNPNLLKVNISKNVSVSNNAEIQLAIQSTLDSIVKKSQVYSNIPAFVAGREHYLSGNEAVYEYSFNGSEIVAKPVPFTGLVTKGLNSNIDIILYQEGEHRTFVGDYDPLNYVKVTNSGAVKVDISELENPEFIEKYFSLAPGIHIGELSVEEALILDLMDLNGWSEDTAIDTIKDVKKRHKGVIPVQYISVVKNALENKQGSSNSGIFYNQTLKSFQDKVNIVKNAESLLKDNTIAKDVKLEEIGISGHSLQIFPNIKPPTEEYSNDFELGGEFQGYKVFAVVERATKEKPGLVLHLYKDGKFDNSPEADKVKENLLKLIGKDKVNELILNKQISYLHYSGEASNIVTPLFMSVKPLEGIITDNFIFNSKLVLNNGNTKVNISLPFTKFKDFYIGGFANNSILHRLSPELDSKVELPFNLLGLKLEQEEVDELTNVGSNRVGSNRGGGHGAIVFEVPSNTNIDSKLIDKFIPVIEKYKTDNYSIQDGKLRPSKKFDDFTNPDFSLVNKAVEQSLKETTKTETTPTTSNQSEIDKRRQEEVKLVKLNENLYDIEFPKEKIDEESKLSDSYNNRVEITEDANYVYVRKVQFVSEVRNKGYGRALYLQLNDIAKQKGKVLHSDRVMKTDAHRLWKSLVKSGDAIQENNNSYRFKTDAELKALEQSLKETTKAEATTSNQAEIEAKKADIERRRQEELEKTNAQLETIEKNGDSFIRVKVEVYTTLSNEETLNEVEIITFKDGSRRVRATDAKTGEIVLEEKIKKDNSTTNEKFIESFIGNLDNSLKKISEDNNPNKTAIDKINAKYDTELKALEQQPTSNVGVEEDSGGVGRDVEILNTGHFGASNGTDGNHGAKDSNSELVSRYGNGTTDLKTIRMFKDKKGNDVDEFHSLPEYKGYRIKTQEKNGKKLVSIHFEAFNVGSNRGGGLGSNVLDRNMLINGLKKYYFDVIKTLTVPDKKNKNKQILPQDIIAILDKTFLASKDYTTNYTNEKYISKKMAEVADMIKGFEDKKLYQSVKEEDFIVNDALSKMHHNINLNNPVNRVLKFNVAVPELVEEAYTPPIVTAEDIIDEADRWDQNVREANYNGDRSLDSLDTRREFLRKISGDDRIQDVDSIESKIDTLMENNVSMGAVIDSVIYLNRQLATQGTFYHEAGHRVFNYLLTESERNTYLEEAKKLGYSEETIKTFLTNRNLPYTPENIDLFYTEQIMNLFAQYKLDKDNASFIATIGYWLKNLFDTLLDFLHISTSPSLAQLFRNIDNGKYRGRVAGKVEPFFQNIKTKGYPLNSEDTENLFYNLYGSLINVDKYRHLLEGYKQSKDLKYLKEFLDLQKEKVTKIIKAFPNIKDERLLNTLRLEENLDYNINLFKDFLEDKLFEFDFIPTNEPDLYEDEFGEEGLSEDEDVKQKESNKDLNKYNEEIFIEPKVKNFINAIISEESIFMGEINGRKQYTPIYTKVNSDLINKAQKDFSLAPIGSDRINHFMTYLEGFARYDMDYKKLLESINSQFQITKKDNNYHVGRQKFFLEGLIKNFAQNRLYYSKVYTKKGGNREKAFDTLVEEELILSNNNANMFSVFSKMGRPPTFNQMNIIIVPATKNSPKRVYIKNNKQWFLKEGALLHDIGDFNIENLYNERIANMSNRDIATFIRNSVTNTNVSLDAYSVSNNKADLDNAVEQIQAAFGIIGIPVTGSYAYMIALNSIKKPFIQGNLDMLDTLIGVAIELERDTLQAGFGAKYLRSSTHSKELVNRLSAVEEELFHALVNGSRLSFNSVKGANGKSYYAFSYNNITSKLETHNDVRFLTNDIIRSPFFRISNMFDHQGIKKSFDKLTEDEIFGFVIAQYKRGFYNLDQLEANSTNFSVKGDVEDFGYITNGTLTIRNEEHLKNRLATAYQDVATSMQKRIKIYDEIQPLLTNAKTDTERQKILEDSNDKYDLSVGVDALSMEDLDKGVISDRAYNKLGFNTFFNLLPVRRFKTRQEVEDYIAEVETDAFKNSLVTAVIGSVRTNLNKLQGLSGAVWSNAISNSDFLPRAAREGSGQDKQTSDLHKSFIFNMTLNYIIQSHENYKRILGKEYFHGFKSANTGEFNKRLKLIGIFGQDIDEGNFIELPDINEVVRNPNPGNWKEDNAYTSEYTDSSKSALEATDGNGIATFERVIQVQKAKTRLDEKVLSYYIAQITNNRFVFENDVQQATPRDIKSVESYAKDSNALNGLFKTALGDAVGEKIKYHKMAYFAVPRDMYMVPKADVTEDQLNAAYKEVALATIAWLNDYANFNAKNDAYKVLYSLHVPVAGQEKLFETYQRLETNNIQVAVHRSGSKAYKSDNIIKVPYGAEKHQTENTNVKKKITLATQADANLSHDQNSNTVVWNGKDIVTSQAMIHEYLQTKKNLGDIKGSLLLGSLFKDGQIDIPLFSYYLKQYVTVTKSKDYLTGLFDITQTDKGFEFHTPTNSPESIYVLLQVVSKIANEVNGLKVPGDAYGLIPASHYAVMEDDLGYVPLKNRASGQTRPLQPRQMIFDGEWHLIPFVEKQAFIDKIRGQKEEESFPIMEVHEIVIPAHEDWQKDYLKDRDAVRRGDMDKSTLDVKYPKELFFVYFTRIPHEEKRSGAVGYIVDFLPPNVGSVGIIPTIKMGEDGHDFDNDKAYTTKPIVVKTEEGWRIKFEPDQTLLDRVENHPFLRQKVKDELTNNTEYQKIEKSLKELTEIKDELYDKLNDFRATVKHLMPIVEDKSASDQEKRAFIIEGILNNTLIATDENGNEQIITVPDELKDLYREYQEVLGSIKFKKSQKNSLRQKAFSYYVNNIRAFNKKMGIEHIEDLDEEVELNKLLNQYISLHSNRHTLETGLIREQTNYDFASQWTKNELKKQKDPLVYSVLGSPLRVVRNIAKTVEGGQGISIAAKFMKTLIDLKEMNADVSGIKLLGMDFNSLDSTDKYTGIGKQFISKLNERISEYNKTVEDPLDLIDESIEDYKLNNLKTSIYVAIMTDSIKNQFGFGLNLNNLTYPVYVIGTALGIPQSALLTIASSEYIRDINTQKKLDNEIDRLEENLQRDEKGRLDKTPPLTEQDLLNLYFYADFAYDNLDSSFELDENHEIKLTNGHPTLSELGKLQLKTLKFVNKVNIFSKSLFSIGTVTNSNKSQLIDQKFKTISLLSEKWNSKEKESAPMYSYLGLEKPNVYTKQSIGFKYANGIPKTRIENVKWDARVLDFFKDYLNLNQNNIATDINKMLGIQDIGTLWFKDMATIIFNANTSYDVSRLPSLKQKIDALNIKYNYKVNLLAKLQWEAGIFYLQKEDKFEKDIVNYQEELKDIEPVDYPVLEELLQATRYIWGWSDTSFSPINYFPAVITNAVTQGVSDTIHDYIHDLEKVLRNKSEGIQAKPFDQGLPIPTKAGVDTKNKGYKYLDPNFESDVTRFKLINVPTGAFELNTYASRGRNIYKKVFSSTREVKKGKFLTDAIYTLVKNYKDGEYALEAFNPFAHTRLTDIDTFKIRAANVQMEPKEMLDGLIYNNIFVAFRTKNDKRLNVKDIQNKFLNKNIQVSPNEDNNGYSIGFVNKLKESYAGTFKNTVFDKIANEQDSIFTFRITTDLPQNELIELYDGEISTSEITDKTKIENTFARLKDFTSEFSNLDILEATNDNEDNYTDYEDVRSEDYQPLELEKPKDMLQDEWDLLTDQEKDKLNKCKK